MSAERAVLKNLALWKGRPIRVTPLHGGYTNHNYLISLGKNKFVARFAPESTGKLGLKRSAEIRNYRIAHKLGIGPRVILHDPKHRLLIVEYLRGNILNSSSVKKPAIIKNIARLLRVVHDGPRLSRIPDALERSYAYIRQAKKMKAWMPADIDSALRDLRRVEKRLRISRDTPSHSDTMLGNIVVGPHGKMMLIDWEYSTNFDRRFDLAFISVKGKFSDKEDRMLINAYAKENQQELLDGVRLMKAIAYFSEAAYCILQYAISDKDADYRGHALRHLRGFEKTIGTIFTAEK